MAMKMAMKNRLCFLFFPLDNTPIMAYTVTTKQEEVKAMKGTEKQIAWANDVKARIMSALDAMSNTDRKAEFDALIAWLNGRDSAAWWIETWQITRTDRMFIKAAIREWRT